MRSTDNIQKTFDGTNIQPELSVVTSTIRQIAPQAKVFLFGSFVDGRPHKYSDFDLCVVVPELSGDRFDLMDRIREGIFDKTSLPTDILLFTNAEFERNAEKKSKIQYMIAHNGVLLNA